MKILNFLIALLLAVLVDMYFPHDNMWMYLTACASSGWLGGRLLAEAVFS